YHPVVLVLAVRHFLLQQCHAIVEMLVPVAPQSLWRCQWPIDTGRHAHAATGQRADANKEKPGSKNCPANCGCCSHGHGVTGKRPSIVAPVSPCRRRGQARKPDDPPVSTSVAPFSCLSCRTGQPGSRRGQGWSACPGW